MANAADLADWLGIPQEGLYNFKPSVRPVPLEVHISGFPGQHYCPRMATMNKPAYRAILKYSPDKPTLVFVSSRRQTRLTALDLIAYCSADEREQQFLRVPADALEPLLADIRDPALRHTLAFGIGIHHAGLAESDRVTVEGLFVEQAINEPAIGPPMLGAAQGRCHWCGKSGHVADAAWGSKVGTRVRVEDDAADIREVGGSRQQVFEKMKKLRAEDLQGDTEYFRDLRRALGHVPRPAPQQPVEDARRELRFCRRRTSRGNRRLALPGVRVVAARPGGRPGGVGTLAR